MENLEVDAQFLLQYYDPESQTENVKTRSYDSAEELIAAAIRLEASFEGYPKERERPHITKVATRQVAFTPWKELNWKPEL